VYTLIRKYQEKNKPKKKILGFVLSFGRICGLRLNGRLAGALYQHEEWVISQGCVARLLVTASQLIHLRGMFLARVSCVQPVARSQSSSRGSSGFMIKKPGNFREADVDFSLRIMRQIP